MADEIDPRVWTLAVALALTETPLLDAAEEASGPPRKASDALRGELRDLAAWARGDLARAAFSALVQRSDAAPVLYRSDAARRSAGASGRLNEARLRYDTAAGLRSRRAGTERMPADEDPWLAAWTATREATLAPRWESLEAWRRPVDLDDRLRQAKDAVYRAARLLGYPGRVVVETWREALDRARRELA